MSVRVCPYPSVPMCASASFIVLQCHVIPSTPSCHRLVSCCLFFLKNIQLPPLTPCFPLLKFDFKGIIYCHGGQGSSVSYEVSFKKDECIFCRTAYYSFLLANKYDPLCIIVCFIQLKFDFKGVIYYHGVPGILCFS